MKTDSKLSKRIVDALGWLNLDEQETIALQAEVMGEIESHTFQISVTKDTTGATNFEG